MAQLEKRIKIRNEERLSSLIEEMREGVESGTLTESRALELGFDFSLGYKHAVGEISEDILLHELNTKDRQYAIRQMRWLKRNPHITWLTSEDIYTEACEVLGCMER